VLNLIGRYVASYFIRNVPIARIERRYLRRDLRAMICTGARRG
jgi:hypothetical protein